MDVDKYLRLSRLETTLLHQTFDKDAPVSVHQHGNERWIYTGEDSILSLMHTDAPAEPVLPNHVAMLAAMLYSGLPGTVLNLGFGSGAFERFFADRLPATRVVSVETSRTMIDIARRYFHTGEHRVHMQPAERFLGDNSDCFDLVLCDIFNGDNHPECLAREGFHRDIARSLAPGGVVTYNLSPATEQALVEILLHIRRSFTHVVLVNLVNYGNVVLFAMQHQPPDQGVLECRAGELGKRLQVDFSGIPAHSTLLPLTPGTQGCSGK